MPGRLTHYEDDRLHKYVVAMISFDADADIIAQTLIATEGACTLERTQIKRQGSYLYARSFGFVVLLLTLIYGGTGAVLAIVTASRLDSVVAEVIVPVVAFIPMLMMWIGYAATLWVFKREARYAIEITEDGIRETCNGREQRFIPWAGVQQIEVAADLFGGMSLKVKGAFSEIAISNIDLEVTEPTSILKVHRALTRAGRMSSLFSRLKAAAPQAELRMNRLARRRMGDSALVSRAGQTQP